MDRFDYVSMFEMAKRGREWRLGRRGRWKWQVRWGRPGGSAGGDEPADAGIFGSICRRRGITRFGAYAEAAELLNSARRTSPCCSTIGRISPGLPGWETRRSGLKAGGRSLSDYCFPNNWRTSGCWVRDQEKIPEGARAYYYLGNLFYDKLQYERATELWEKSVELDGCFPVALRNLALSYYNKMGRRGGSESRDGAGLRSEPGGYAHFSWSWISCIRSWA